MPFYFPIDNQISIKILQASIWCKREDQIHLMEADKVYQH